MAWHLAGLGVVAGATARAPEVSAEGATTARQRADAVARRYGVPVIDRATLAEWRRESDRRTLYVMDVRDPAEYRAGHLPGSRRPIGAGDRQLARHLGRPRRPGRRHRRAGAHDRFLAPPDGLGRVRARGRARRCGAGTWRAGGTRRHLSARRPRTAKDRAER